MCKACHERHLRNAQAMKEKFPDLLASYSVEEVCDIWERYSDEYFAAGWLGGYLDEEERVQRVFTILYRKEQEG